MHALILKIRFQRQIRFKNIFSAFEIDIMKYICYIDVFQIG